MDRADVAIVGLGALGSACAAHAARSGLSVVGFDRGAPPHQWGSSAGGTRIQRCAYFEGAEYVPLARRALELWLDLQAECGDELWVNSGVLGVGSEGGELVERTLISAELHGIPCERLDSGALAARYPGIRIRDEIGAWEPGAGILLVDACLRAHLGVAVGAGAELHLEEEVLAWEPASIGKRGIVRSADHTVEADWLVVAPGAWLPDVAPGEPAARLAVERQVQFYFDGGLVPDLPVVIWEYEPDRHFYLVPDADGQGTKIALHHQGEITRAGSLDRAVTPDDFHRLRVLIDQFIPALSGHEPVAAKVCMYENSVDDRFLCGSLPQADRTVLLGGGSGHAFKFASALGEAAATLVGGGAPAADIQLFDPGRFTAGSEE